MPRRARRSRHRVCLLAYDGLCTFEFAAAAEILQDRSDAFGDRWYTLQTCALERAPLRTDTGLVLPAGTRGVAALLDADTLIVPGWRMGPVPEDISAAVSRAHRQGVRIASICTGAFVLAAAGVLDGKRATTHWKHAARLAADYPAVQVDPTVLYIDEGSVVTSAGSAAGIDMLLHLIRRDYGARTCNAVARTMVVPPHRDGGQAQYVESAVPRERSEFSKVFDHIRRHPARSHRIESLAAIAAMTPRTFFRRFRAATGRTPYDWLLYERIRIAKDLLENSRLSIDRIASDAGFGAADTLRHHFRRVVGTTPRDYRDLFKSTGQERPVRAGSKPAAVDSY